jgi:hypothetical protein
MQRQEKKCCICSHSFIPHPKVGKRQKTCGKQSCQRIHKENNDAKWRLNNPNYSRNDYARVKSCMEKNLGYLNRYRQDHPEYIQKNRDDQRRRDRIKKLHLDIHAKLSRQPFEILGKLESAPHYSRLDIQADFILNPIEITYILSRFAYLPCFDIQAKLDFTAPFLDNGPIKQGSGKNGCQIANRSGTNHER